MTSSVDAPGRQREHDVVEAALHVEGRGQRLLVHPEDAEALVVGHQLARPDAVDVLGRQRDADDGQAAEASVDDRRHLIAQLELVGDDEAFAGQHLVGAAALDPAAAPQEQVVDARPPVRRESTRAGPWPARRVRSRSSVTLATTRVSTADTPGMAAISAATRSGARLSEAKTSPNRCRS